MCAGAAMSAGKPGKWLPALPQACCGRPDRVSRGRKASAGFCRGNRTGEGVDQSDGFSA